MEWCWRRHGARYLLGGRRRGGGWLVDAGVVGSGGGQCGGVNVVVVDMGAWAGWGYRDVGGARRRGRHDTGGGTPTARSGA